MTNDLFLEWASKMTRRQYSFGSKVTWRLCGGSKLTWFYCGDRLTCFGSGVKIDLGCVQAENDLFLVWGSIDLVLVWVSKLIWFLY